MSIPSTDSLTTEQLEALLAQVKQQLKKGILPTDKAVIELAGQIIEVAKNTKTTSEKVLAAVKLALGGKLGGTRNVSRNSAIRKALKAAGVQKFPLKTSIKDLEHAYIEKFGQAEFDQKIDVIPASKATKK